MLRHAGLLILLLVLFAGCGGDNTGETVVARVGDHQITREDINRRLGTMPPNVRQQFETEEGRQRLLEGMIEEEAIFVAALEQKLQDKPLVKRRIYEERRRVLIQSYYQREIEPYTLMTEDDLRSYYEERLDDLYTKPLESVVRQVVLGSRGEAERVRQLLVEGADWAQIVDNYCIDEPTKKRLGRIGPVAAQAALIPLVGSAPEMTATIDSLTVGTISPVVQTSKGFHVLTVTERIPEALLPFEKMKETIQRTFQSSFNDKVRKEKVAVLQEKYGVTIMSDKIANVGEVLDEEAVAKTEEAQILFERAQKVADPQQRIDYYEEIIRDYPEDEHVCEAQFMVGFVYSEELNNFDLARDALQAVIDRETGCSDELKSSARWMLENMGKEPPKFETD